MDGDQRIPVGGDGNHRTLEKVGGGKLPGRVMDRVDLGGEALSLLQELITETRAVRRGLELALGVDLIEASAAG